MLGISINGEFLDLSPRTSAQLERSSPFFNSTDLAAEYSLPFTFSYSPKNARLLGLPNHYYTKRIKKKIEARLHDNNNFAYAGQLVIETAELNVNDISKSTISGFFLTGVSSFFTLIKNKKLKELTLGGVRQFAWTNEDPAGANFGFWQHVHQTLNGLFDYSFAPIRNQNWSGSTEAGTPDWMNKLDDDSNLDFQDNFTTLVPQVSLKYLLQQIFAEHDWEFDYSLMDDKQWETMFLPSFFAVKWQRIIPDEDPPYFHYTPLPTIEINLQNHVPPEMYITELIIALRNRYNWGFDFNSGKKVCKMFPLKNLANGTKKDWTRYMARGWSSNFSEDLKIFAFKNEIDSNDQLSSQPDFKKATYGPPVESYSDLAAADENNFNQVIYVWKENKYYRSSYNETDNLYFWDVFADGIYDYEPDGTNESITTVASTMPVYKTVYRNNGISDMYGLFPLCEQEGNWEGKDGEFIPWGLRLLFHRGKVFEANPAGAMGTNKYPYLTSIAFTITQEEPDLAWSNVYKHEFNGVDLGIIRFWWQSTLKYMQQADVITGNLFLPRQELLNFAWSDVILLLNIPYIMQKINETIPYDDIVKCDLRRIG